MIHVRDLLSDSIRKTYALTNRVRSMPSDYLHRVSNSLRGSLLSAVHVEFRRLLDFTHVLALTCFVLSCVLPNENVWISANLSLLKSQPPIRLAKKFLKVFLRIFSSFRQPALTFLSQPPRSRQQNLCHLSLYFVNSK